MIEMEDLSTRKREFSSRNNDRTWDHLQDTETSANNNNTIFIWAFVKAMWLVLLSLPLLFFPRALLFWSSPSGGEHRNYLTPLEAFLSTHFGILLLSLAVGLLVSIPPDSPVQSRRLSTHPLLLPVTCGSLLTAFLSYNTPASRVGPFATFVALGAGGTGIWGIWALLFAGSSLISPKTGANKRISRFFFGNRPASSAQKKQ